MLRDYIHKYTESAWLLGFVPNGLDGLIASDIHWINKGKYTNKWFADPFILDLTESVITLLVEEFDYAIGRGRIAKLLVDRHTMVITDCKVILDLDTHLSFPFIWRHNDEIYVAPENYKSGGWNLYRYNRQSDLLEFIVKLSDLPLTDASILNINDSTFVFSTLEPHPNGTTLGVWKAISPVFPQLSNDPFVRIEFNENIARNAGEFFAYNNKLIRPAQESNQTYGHALVFQEINFDDKYITFNELFRYKSPHPKYNKGIHTFNTYNGSAIIDVKGNRYPIIARFITILSRIAVKLHLKKKYTIH